MQSVAVGSDWSKADLLTFGVECKSSNPPGGGYGDITSVLAENGTLIGVNLLASPIGQ